VTGKNSGSLRIYLKQNAPDVWMERRAAQKNQDFLICRIRWDGAAGNSLQNATLTFDPVKFVFLKAVTNDGIIGNAKAAVELAIGLIGIMALWLGVMKIAEQAGLVALLARILKPATSRLFPDVPPDHPAMGAMIMNISANMLGLANAATPLGLKAMEELNSLNKKLGTATDAMCTFLVINTSNVQLIPATVIAIRAASGSKNPAEILGPVLVATAVALLAGIVTVKLLARLPVFRKQLEATAP
jgi:spore maturation protein A